MSVLFSKVALLADDCESTVGFLVCGIPQVEDDLKGYAAYDNFVGEHAESECFAVEVESYIYGMHLQKDAATIVCDEFGVDRVNYVLANTIQNLEWDGRFSQSNKDWAKRFFIPKSEQNTAFSISSHPAVLDGFVNQTRQYYNSLGLFDENHCVKNDQSQNYKGRLLVIKAEVLDDEFKTPDYQLFYAKSGFGCDPDSSGQKVFGFFLKDGEIAHFDRTDFAGALSRP